MEYEKYRPSHQLMDLVECYFIWRSPRPKSPIFVDTPPTAFAAIVFNLAESHSVSVDQKHFLRLPSTYISGQCTGNYALKIDSEINQVGIVFRPTGLHHLYGLQMFEFSNAREDLRNVLPGYFSNMEEKLSELPSDQMRINLLESQLLKRLVETRLDLDGVDEAARQIIDNHGLINVSNLVSEAYMSRRKFERHFLKRVGLSPKYYARIRRYGHLCSLMAGQREVSWNQLLYEAGYYDQSHFIKDFREFSGVSPSQYLETNNELAHLVDSVH